MDRPNHQQFITALSIFIVLGIVLSSSLAQSTNTIAIQPTTVDPEQYHLEQYQEQYGPGFPDYCIASQYKNRPECISYFGDIQIGRPIPVESDPCYLTGGYEPGCIPEYQYPCLPGDPSPSCLPVVPPDNCNAGIAETILCSPQPPVGYLPPTHGPFPIEPPTLVPCLPVPDGCVPLTVPPALNYTDFRLEPPPLAPNCQTGYSPHCLPIAPTKLFHHSYATAPAIPTYRVGETFKYRVDSPYLGYLYVFVVEPDNTTQLIYPNQVTDNLYVNPGKPITFPRDSNNYTLTVAKPYGLHKLLLVVLPQALPKEHFESIQSEYELQEVLFQLGIDESIHHGYAESAFEVVR